MNAGVEGSALKAAAREWGELRNTRIEVVELPYANLFEKESLDLTSRTGAYDVIMLDDPWFPRLVADGGSRRCRARPMPTSWPVASRFAAIRPHRNISTRCLTWAIRSFFSIARICSTKYKLGAPDPGRKCWTRAKTIGAGEKMFGYVMRAAPGNAAVADFMPLLWAFGGDIFDAQGKPNLRFPEAIEALRFMLELGKILAAGIRGLQRR